MARIIVILIRTDPGPRCLSVLCDSSIAKKPAKLQGRSLRTVPHSETARTVTWTCRRPGPSIATAPSKFFFEQKRASNLVFAQPPLRLVQPSPPAPHSTMADHGVSRFTPQNKSTHERLSTHTVGLVALSDFRKRRAEVLEQQEREAREAAISGTTSASASASASTSSPAPDRSSTGTPDNAGSQPGTRPLTKPRRKRTKTTGKKLLLSFGGDDDDEGDDDEQEAQSGGTDGGDPPAGKPRSGDADTADESDTGAGAGKPRPRPRFRANASVGIVPRAVTKAALLKEATEREALRREFVAVQEAVKATEVALPFVFYDGTNIPGGTVRVKKGDFVWVFLDRSRKVGAELGVRDKRNTRRGWARVGVDDLMLVRDTVIIPHVCFPCSYSMYDIRTPLLTLQRHPSALQNNSTMISTSSS